VAQIAASIREFGFTNPVLVDGERGVIAGHGRLLAARQLGMDTVPTLELSHLSTAQRRAYVLADNRLALSAGWDEDLLRVELGDLQAEGFDLGLTGFDELEIAGFLAEPSAGLTDPDEVPAPPEVPVTRPGDVWLLGRHRLVCGDSTDPAAVAKALAGTRPHLMVTDPPYGVAYDPAWRVRGGIAGEGAAQGTVLNDGRADWREAWALFPGDVAYVWCASLHSHEVAESLLATGFGLRSQIIWDKTRLIISRGDYHWQHEPCWYAVRQGKTGHWAGDRKQTTVWAIGHQKSETGHGTQKPVECMRRPIENNSSPGQAVYEPFSGSGTTLIAAEMTGRACHAIELSPAYVDVAVLRWQAFTGLQATLEASREPWGTVVAQRNAVSQDSATAAPRPA
jgi:DNA modification methylase